MTTLIQPEHNPQPQAPIHGLRYLPEFITPQEEIDLIQQIDSEEWSGDLSRRVQHYGFRYDYKLRRVDLSMKLGPLPGGLRNLSQRLVSGASPIFQKLPDQCIVNEYTPGQGIAPHIDCKPCFGPIIASLSLLGGCFMDFTRPTSSDKIPVWLEPRSLVALQGEARTAWRHGIAARRSDRINGIVIPRARRVSITFRNVIVS